MYILYALNSYDLISLCKIFLQKNLAVGQWST